MVKGAKIMSAWDTEEQLWDCPSCGFGQVEDHA